MSQEGTKLIMSLVDAGQKGFGDFIDYQFTDGMFRGDESEMYEFVRKHAMKYGQLPSRKTINKWAKGEGIPMPSKDVIVEPADYYYDALEHRNLKLNLLRAMKDAEEHRQHDPQHSLESLTQDILALQNHKRRHHLINIVNDGGTIVEREMARVLLGNDKGLKFGWPTLDAMADGLRGGDLISIVGRPGMGKTFMALYGMLNAWGQGMNTLFVSMEMQATPIVQRVVSMYTGTSLGELKQAQLSSAQEKKMKSLVGGMGDVGGDMWVADGRLSMNVQDILMLCQQLKPDALFIDGAYLLRHQNPRLQRHDRINSNCEDVKMLLAEGLNIPVTQTFQFNRGMTKKKEVEDVDLEDIAGSDAIGQLSSLVLGTFQDDNIETKLVRLIRILKGRSGEQGEFKINWRFGGFGVMQDESDFDTSDIMNFHEIVPEKVSSEMNFM